MSGVKAQQATQAGPVPGGRPGPAGRCPVCGGTATGWLPEPIQAALPRVGALTPREHAVFLLLGSGYDNRSIARELSISERTVKRYVTAILAKLALQSRLQAGLSAFFFAAAPAGGARWPEGLMEEPSARN